MQSIRQFSPPSRQSGAVLLVAVVLLLLAGVMTLFALNAGVFEQRSTGNDIRAKAVNDVAEAGLSQGFEYLMRQHPDMLSNISLWEKCVATDVTFPCGAITADLVDVDGDPATTATVARRATMYRLKATSNTITGLDDALANYMLPLASASKIATAANGSTVAYGVAPVLCLIKRPLKPDDPLLPPIPVLCGDGVGSTGATDLRVATFVSVAKIPGESASATLVQTIGQYPKLGDLIDQPPITTAGSAGVTGTLQIVANPNAGGPGVPVSVWTRVDVQKTGTTNTCYADEFFRYTKNNVTPTPYQGTIRCDACQCDVNGAPTTLSYDNSGNLQDEGIDILDVEAGTNSNTGYQVSGHQGANYNVRSDSLSYPTCEFPPDLFKYVFGVAVWEDTNGDCFGDRKFANVLYVNDGGASAMVDPDEAWLYKNADRIIGAPDATLLNPGQAGTSALLASSASSGIIWCHAGCVIGSNVQVGTPAAPVVLILDGPVDIRGTVFGFIFVRDPVQNTGVQATLSPISGSNSSGGCPSNCMVQMNAGAAVYGAMVIQGQLKANGTSAVIYDKTVLGNIGGDNNLVRATLPGAWNDQRSY
ncbi:MAG: hypothetical protein ACMG5Z_05795 [Luteimonas sp.]